MRVSGTLVFAMSSFPNKPSSEEEAPAFFGVAANGLAVVCAPHFGVIGAVVSDGGASKGDFMVVFSEAHPADFVPVLCVYFLLFWAGQFNLRNRAQGPSQIAHGVIFVGFVMVLCRFVLVSAGLAGFCLVFYDFELVSACLAAFCVVRCWSQLVFVWLRFVRSCFGLVSAGLAAFV